MSSGKVAGSIGPRDRASLARITQYPFQELEGRWALQLYLDTRDGGFQSVEISTDAGDHVPLPSRAIIRDRARVLIQHTVEQLRDSELDWRPLSVSADGVFHRGVQLQADKQRRGMSVLLLNAKTVPSWYKGQRRLAIANYLERLDVADLRQLPPVQL